MTASALVHKALHFQAEDGKVLNAVYHNDKIVAVLTKHETDTDVYIAKVKDEVFKKCSVKIGKVTKDGRSFMEWIVTLPDETEEHSLWVANIKTSTAYGQQLNPNWDGENLIQDFLSQEEHQLNYWNMY